MNKSFRWRLTSNFIFVIALFLSLSLIISYFIFKDFYLYKVEENLLDQTALSADIISGSYDENDQNYLKQISNKIARDTGVRVTVVDGTNGDVLADSGFDSNLMESHKSRPEIFKALKGQTGSDIRFSSTAQMDMLYVAVPFKTDNFTGVVRLAEPLNEIESILFKILSLLFLAIVLTAIAAFIISAIIANRLARPLADITESVEDISRGNFSRRITGQYNDNEFEGLSSAINHMAEYLEGYVNQITEVKSQLEALLDNTVNGIMMIDASGRINYVNPVAKTLLFPDTDPLNRKHVDVICDYEIIAIIDRLRKNPQTIKSKIILYSKGNRYIDVHALPVSTGTGQPSDSILLVLNDITEITHLKQVRRDFIANVTHELKTPMASIKGFAETMLSEKVESREEYREFSQIIYNEAQRLTQLIDDLFELSRIENAVEELPRQEADMGALIAETIKLVEKKPGGENYRIRFVPPPQPVIAVTDPHSVIQIMINLLDNAVKFSRPEEEITITLDEDPQSITVSIIDRGEGIPEKDLSRIFERFYRVDQARSRKTGGTGLGLSIVKHLTERLGGKVGVESRPGEGSKFYFSIPGRS